MSYPVKDDDSLVEKSPVLFGRESDVVEEAKSEGLAVFSVVTRGPDQTQTVTETAGADCNTRSVISTLIFPLPAGDPNLC